MKEKIILLKNNTIYQITGSLGVVIPLIYITFGNEKSSSILFWVCILYFIVMLLFFIIRSMNKKSMDKPGLVGVLVPAFIIFLSIFDIIP